MAEYKFHYSHFPELRKYIDRIEAEQTNFKRFVVREYFGEHRSRYYRDKAVIKLVLEPEFEIKCSSEQYEPTAEESQAIKAELAKVEWPHSILAGEPEADEFISSGAITGTAYKFYDLKRSAVVTIEERREKDGKKYYVRWTLFMANGEKPQWRMMDPDGDHLPFWKPRHQHNKASVMIHEGAKTAAFIDGLVNDPDRRQERKAHPWADELARFEHWGASGGSGAIYRSDFGELHAADFLGDVLYVCDNDASGVEAVKTFSRLHGKPMLAIMFGERFPPGWDLADKIPNTLINGHDQIDVRLRELIRPATFATKVVGRRYGRDVYDLTDYFAREWAHTITPELYINQRWPRLMFSSDKFNNYVAPFAHPRVEVSELLKLRVHGQAETIKYHPGLEPGFHSSADGTFFNTYQHRHFELYGPREQPDLAMFEEFLTKLFPIERDRLEAKRWAATLIARPAVNMRYGLLLVSDTQGVGKTGARYRDRVGRAIGERLAKPAGL